MTKPISTINCPICDKTLHINRAPNYYGNPVAEVRHDCLKEEDTYIQFWCARTGKSNAAATHALLSAIKKRKMEVREAQHFQR